MPVQTLSVTAPPSRPPSGAPRASRRAAVAIALLFLGATATFLAGDALVVGALETSTVDTAALRIGVALQAVNALAVAGLGVAFLRVLPERARGLARGHLALRIVEAIVIVGIGGFMLATESLVDYEPVIYVFTGSAGLLLTAALARTSLIERWLVLLGMLGYVAILAALPLGLFTSMSLDTFPGLLLYVPGGLFEFALPVLLLVRGFRRADRDTSRRSSWQRPDERSARPVHRACTRPVPANGTVPPQGTTTAAQRRRP